MNAPNIPAENIMRLLVESLGMAKTLDLLAAESNIAAIRCSMGTSEPYKRAAQNYHNVGEALSELRKRAYPQTVRESAQ